MGVKYTVSSEDNQGCPVFWLQYTKIKKCKINCQ
jgi:hypothetical protein